MRVRRIYYRKKLNKIIIETKIDGKTKYLKALPEPSKLLGVLNLIDYLKEQNKTYPEEFYSVRKEIIKRDNMKCVMCGSNEIAVHHIDHDRKNNREQNLITLCKQCHSRYHRLDALKKDVEFVKKVRESVSKC